MTIRIAHQHWLDKMLRSGDMGHRCVQGHRAPFGETAGTQGGFPCLGVRPPRGNTHDPVQRRGLTCRPGDSSAGRAVWPESPPRGSGARALRRGSSFRATYGAGNLYHETVIPSLNKCPFPSLSILLPVCLPAYHERVEIVTGGWPRGVRPEHMMLECRDRIRLRRLLLILQIAQDLSCNLNLSIDPRHQEVRQRHGVSRDPLEQLLQKRECGLNDRLCVSTAGLAIAAVVHAERSGVLRSRIPPIGHFGGVYYKKRAASRAGPHGPSAIARLYDISQTFSTGFHLPPDCLTCCCSASSSTPQAPASVVLVMLGRDSDQETCSMISSTVGKRRRLSAS
jgi:hypothetical protein